MQCDELVIKYLNYKISKVRAIKQQHYQVAAELRDMERKVTDEICKLLDPNYIWESWALSDAIIDEYCLKNYNCSLYEATLCLKSIERLKKLKELGI